MSQQGKKPREFVCVKCGREMDSDLVGLPGDEGARVFWHKDGTPDNCNPAYDALLAQAEKLAENLDIAETLLSIPERHQDGDWFEKQSEVSDALADWNKFRETL